MSECSTRRRWRRHVGPSPLRLRAREGDKQTLCCPTDADGDATRTRALQRALPDRGRLKNGSFFKGGRLHRGHRIDKYNRQHGGGRHYWRPSYKYGLWYSTNTVSHSMTTRTLIYPVDSFALWLRSLIMKARGDYAFTPICTSTLSVSPLFLRHALAHGPQITRSIGAREVIHLGRKSHVCRRAGSLAGFLA